MSRTVEGCLEEGYGHHNRAHRQWGETQAGGLGEA